MVVLKLRSSFRIFLVVTTYPVLYFGLGFGRSDSSVNGSIKSFEESPK